MPAARQPGVFCVEGEWSAKLTDRSSVQPMLQALEGLGVAQVVHRRVATVGELEHYLKRWTQKQYDDYVLGYLAFHGEPGRVQLGRTMVSLDDLAEILDGRCEGRILHFGSCSVLKGAEADLKQFLRRTKARAICGYTEDIGWLPGAAFDFLLVEELLQSQHLGHALRRVISRYPDMVRELGFRLITPRGSDPRAAP